MEPERVDEPLQFAGVAGELSGGVLDNLAHVGVSVVELPNPRIDLAPNNLRLETPTKLLTLGRVEPMLPSEPFDQGRDVATRLGVAGGLFGELRHLGTAGSRALPRGSHQQRPRVVLDGGRRRGRDDEWQPVFFKSQAFHPAAPSFALRRLQPPEKKGGPGLNHEPIY